MLPKYRILSTFWRWKRKQKAVKLIQQLGNEKMPPLMCLLYLNPLQKEGKVKKRRRKLLRGRHFKNGRRPLIKNWQQPSTRRRKVSPVLPAHRKMTLATWRLRLLLSLRRYWRFTRAPAIKAMWWAMVERSAILRAMQSQLPIITRWTKSLLLVMDSKRRWRSSWSKVKCRNWKVSNQTPR